MAFVRNIVIVIITIAFYNRFLRKQESGKDKVLDRYDYVIGKFPIYSKYKISNPFHLARFFYVYSIVYNVFTNVYNCYKCSVVPVGGGSGGGVLSDDGQHNVLLLEAGWDDQSPIGQQVHIPINYIPNLKSEADWEYYTEPQEHSCLAMKDKVFSTSNIRSYKCEIVNIRWMIMIFIFRVAKLLA